MAGSGDERTTQALIGSVYDAALAPERWPSVVAAIARATGGTAASLMLHDTTGAGSDVFAMHGYSAEALATYGRDFASGDGRQRELARSPAGQVLADGHNLDLSAYRRTTIFNEFFSPLGLEHGLGVSLFADAGRVGVFSMLRPTGDGAFTTGDMRMIRHLAPHVRRALQVHGQLGRAAVLGAGLADALDHMPTAVFLVERDGRITLMNGAAERLVRQPSCPLLVLHGRLSARGVGGSAISRAICAAASDGEAPPAVVRLAASDGSALVSVMAARARPGGQLGWPSRPLVLVFAAGLADLPDMTLLTRQFGLSLAEAAVAVELTKARDIDDIADRRGVSRGTVRIQLKAILAKTQTHSQRQLMVLVTTSLAMLRRRD